ncbi:menaquinone biosynthesis family protein [Campylobacter ureolyticus]|uniref:1,4-dihydroxy-6-naphtoate synthase n=1 Tax=Campylobacter ureolyticus TaxID=827 RepID=A0AAE7E8S3_9BACT|nr:MqnA/MqnD/SBP family protein [Campylobacter ureolyticus]MCR8684927.1 S-ribosylhomocysteine lyase [Campylobacter ureolyticus]QKF83717.1 1,4-dihydroxy-6-naphthoate synthase [Campylobacter ureolyticus]QQY36126.1 S-ribosylhomocysteine lyase [Campylobacter ureolyticus]SUX24938.1 succinyl-CoA ligase subunit alpha [Campylobacter ureolyticus]
MLKNISVAHSPDADDIFMYMAIKFGWVDSEILSFNNKADDIETLNKASLSGEYDVCAISFSTYPLIVNDYALLKTAVSFGEGYGPKLIKKKGIKLKKNFKVALSGEHTTNALLFKIAYPDARPIYKNFLEIENAVLNGEVDAGVLIHESILEFNENLEVEREIWDIWQELRGDENLPLPLGGMALRRSLPLTDAIECQRVLTKAVEIATKHKTLLSKMLIERNLVRVDDKKLDKYLNLYANDTSVSMSEIQLKAVNKLFEIGYKHGFYKEKIDAFASLIPAEYRDFRFC